MIKIKVTSNATTAYGMCSEWRNLIIGSWNSKAEDAILSPWQLYDREAKRRCNEVNKNLEYESRKNVANVLRIVLLGLHEVWQIFSQFRQLENVIMWYWSQTSMWETKDNFVNKIQVEGA